MGSRRMTNRRNCGRIASVASGTVLVIQPQWIDIVGSVFLQMQSKTWFAFTIQNYSYMIVKRADDPAIHLPSEPQWDYGKVWWRAQWMTFFWSGLHRSKLIQHALKPGQCETLNIWLSNHIELHKSPSTLCHASANERIVRWHGDMDIETALWMEIHHIFSSD